MQGGLTGVLQRGWTVLASALFLIWACPAVATPIETPYDLSITVVPEVPDPSESFSIALQFESAEVLFPVGSELLLQASVEGDRIRVEFDAILPPPLEEGEVGLPGAFPFGTREAALGPLPPGDYQILALVRSGTELELQTIGSGMASLTVVPEPATIILAGLSLAVVMLQAAKSRHLSPPW